VKALQTHPAPLLAFPTWRPRLKPRARSGAACNTPALLHRLGPGLVAGACNEDPGSIGTYAQVGAQFGYGLAWTLLFTYPLLVAVQEISARVARVTGCGVAGNLRRHFPPWLAAALVGSLAMANIINLAADLGAMATVLRMLFGAPAFLYVCLLGLLTVGFEVFTRYARYVRTLRWLCLSLLSYVVCAFVVQVPWATVGRALIWWPLSATPEYAVAVVAALGTTISPYLIFWQAQQEVERERNGTGAPPLLRSAGEARGEFRRIRLDTLLGFGLSSMVAFFIVVTTASTLHAHGTHAFQSAADAAEALRAIAGRFAFMVFALGIIGTGLLALPALSSSAAYAVGEVLCGRVGPGEAPGRPRAFYAALAASTGTAAALSCTAIDPMRTLYWSAVLNGVVAVPLMIALMRLSTSTAVMGTLVPRPGLRALASIAIVAMGCSIVAMTLMGLGASARH